MRKAGTWLLFAAFAAVLAAVLGWVSRTALRLDDAQAEAEARAVYEEQVRLALWRLDSAVTPLLARESLRPFSGYLQSEGGEHVLGCFELRANGSAGAAAGLDHADLVARLGDGPLIAREPVLLADAGAAIGGLAPPAKTAPSRLSPTTQRGKSRKEFAKRSLAVQQAIDVYNYNAPVAQQAVAPAASRLGTPLQEGILQPLWAGDVLLLARRALLGEESLVQGCRLDWPSLRDGLLREIGDLLPGATLAPAARADPAERLLATLPVRLVAPPTGPPEREGWTPLQISLVFAWLGAGVALGAVGLLLSGAVALSERRAAFVSAVTHELRTPLTTFRMYTEMLDLGMVEGEKRQQYVSTLRREADRLGHLVENVLTYARIERGRRRRAREPVVLGELVERIRPRLEDRAAQGGMVLESALPEVAAEARVRVDPPAVEQILFNLVDNAVKYAGRAEDRRVVLELAGLDRRRVALAVRDFGPGVPPGERSRVFRPFMKSSRDATGPVPGVGLGLALCRRLADDQGGRLELVPAARGARFVLTLRRVRETP